MMAQHEGSPLSVSTLAESLVSILVPTRNSAGHLAVCLESLRAQTYEKLEIIVIDNTSTDGTREIAEAIADIVIVAGPERCSQLNAGARVANGAYIYRVDSDVYVEPLVVSQAVDACQRGADAVAVHNDSSPTVSYWSRVRAFERRMYQDDALIVGARFFRKTAFTFVRGFDESLVAGEDYDIHNRLIKSGCRIARIRAKEIHLGEPRTLGEIIAKSFYYGQTLPEFISRNGRRGVAQLSPIRTAYVRHFSEFCSRPSLTIGFIVMQLAKYAAGAAGFTLSLLGFVARRR